MERLSGKERAIKKQRMKNQTSKDAKEKSTFANISGKIKWENKVLYKYIHVCVWIKKYPSIQEKSSLIHGEMKVLETWLWGIWFSPLKDGL